MKIIDLTQEFTNDIPVYPGDPIPHIEQISDIENHGFNDHKLTTAMHVGTHIDAPLHMLSGGKKMSEINTEKFIGHGIIIDARGKNSIDVDLLNGVELPAKCIVLICTGFSKKFHEKEYWESYPALTVEFAQKLVDADINIVGMDTASPDKDESFPVHKLLLKNEILIIENHSLV